MRKKFNEITWTSLKLNGARLVVSIKENDAPIIENAESVTEEFGQDMIAAYDGTIVSMIVRSGIPKVAVGEYVENGKILVEGKIPVLNEDTTVREYLYVEADADILLQHVIEYQDDIPLVYQEKYYTGREKTCFFFRLGQKEWQFGRRVMFQQYDVLTRLYQPELFQKLRIPIYVGEIGYREYYYLEKKYSEEQVNIYFDSVLEQFISSLEEKGVQIIEKDVKISNNDNKWIQEGKITVIEPVNTKLPTWVENNADNGE